MTQERKNRANEEVIGILDFSVSSYVLKAHKWCCLNCRSLFLKKRHQILLENKRIYIYIYIQVNLMDSLSLSLSLSLSASLFFSWRPYISPIAPTRFYWLHRVSPDVWKPLLVTQVGVFTWRSSLKKVPCGIVLTFSGVFSLSCSSCFTSCLLFYFLASEASPLEECRLARRYFWILPDTCGLRPCIRTNFKKGLVQYLSGGGMENK